MVMCNQFTDDEAPGLVDSSGDEGGTMQSGELLRLRRLLTVYVDSSRHVATKTSTGAQILEKSQIANL